MVLGLRFEMVNDSFDPADKGFDSPIYWVVFTHPDSVICDVEYRISYSLAVPDEPLLPGAVHLRVTEFLV